MKKLFFVLSMFLSLSLNAQNTPELYNYSGTVVRVYDGDTIWVDLDLGFNVTLNNVKIRLFGINTPEIRTKNDLEKQAGKLLEDWVRSTILGKKVVLSTHKDGQSKYGDYLGTIWIDGVNLNEYIAVNKLAHRYYGNTKVPFSNQELEYILYYQWGL